ncbi:hypothetical protein DSO57_1024437 [Entomophthora muscae]|uniref:Uncharacterized protein n=1 Tax=Entomophthora muscae TaxID=34485 RepID=A0ACC2UMG6_9FUNG|nr:hypothetical protein DSO57_1024437 [Entomophthora muscae]
MTDEEYNKRYMAAIMHNPPTPATTPPPSSPIHPIPDPQASTASTSFFLCVRKLQDPVQRTCDFGVTFGLEYLLSSEVASLTGSKAQKI